MRVLWFSPVSFLNESGGISHNGGGWISSLASLICKRNEVELGIAFNSTIKVATYMSEGISYIPIYNRRVTLFEKLFKKQKMGEVNAVTSYLRVVDDFKPNIIQVFGSETDFGLICKHTRIPVVIHLQGCLPPYYNALFPIRMNTFDFFITRGLRFRSRIMGIRSESAFKRNAEREVRIIQSCKYFMGRTEWDRGLISLMNPQASYFHCEESLRDSFTHLNKHWHWTRTNQVKIVSVISNPWYKGVDLILKTANLLIRFANIKFIWDVYGVSNIKFYENKYGIKARDVNVVARGVASKEELSKALMDCSCFVHPSYIENSPNSICEAQIIGTPVIATNVGGVSTILKNGDAGILVPANAPYTLAITILKLTEDKERCLALSQKEIHVATKRHEPEAIGSNLMNIYRQILNDSQNYNESQNG